MSTLPNGLLFAEGTPEAKEKQGFLDKHRVVTPYDSLRVPPQRISFEQLQQLVINEKQRLLMQMERCPEGQEATDAYRRADVGSPTAMFVDAMHQAVLPQYVPGYNRLKGFDTDAAMALFLDSRTQQHEFEGRITVELFPRETNGLMETAAASAIRFEAPITFKPQTLEFDAFCTFVAAEAMQRGERPETILLRLMQHRGLWHLEQIETIGMFLNFVASKTIDHIVGSEDSEQMVVGYSKDPAMTLKRAFFEKRTGS